MKLFTPREFSVVLFLLVGFAAGLAVKWMKQNRIHLPEARGPEVVSAESYAPQAVSLKLNMNTASCEQLVQLPGIGPKTAEKIIAFRSANGAFKHLDSLESIRGIGPKTIERLRPLVVVE